MTPRTLPRLLLTAAAIGVLALTTACAPSDTAPQEPAKPGTKTEAPATPKTDEPDAPAAAPTCETLISAGTVEALTAQGWSAQKRDFQFGPDVVPGGLQCLWADFSQASDHGQLYGWAPISADAAKEEQKKLVDQGWIREESDRGVYITVDPQFSFNGDEEGYGMTYLFGDGWVTLADTKQGLVLINLPGQ